MADDIRNYSDRLRPPGILYVDVYPFRRTAMGGMEFLLLRRRTDIVLPGDWQAVSGKIRAGERIADAFATQVRKKTGLSPLRLLKFATVTTFYDEHYDTVMLVPAAAAELSHEIITVDSAVHTEARWVDLDTANTLLRWDNQYEALITIAKWAAGDAGGALVPLNSWPGETGRE